MTAHRISAPARIHAPNCHCPRCRHVRRHPGDQLDRRIRVALCILGALTGLALSVVVTPQQIAAAIAAPFSR